MTIAAVAHPDARQLEAYALGTLDFDDVLPLEEHLAECDSCCDLLNDVSEDSFLALIRQSARAETWEAVGEETALLSQGSDDAPPNDDFGLSSSPVKPFAPADAEWVPDALLHHGRYRIFDRCGAGGMGVVYRAEHRLMGREVALKVIRPQLLRRPDAVDRFRREVRAAALLSHPHIVSAYDAEEADGSHFLVMEYVAGSDLASIVAQQGPLPVHNACDYIRQAAEGLMHAHERGMVHRDVKPQNLMLTPDGRVKILDFGLSKFASETETEKLITAPSDDMLGSTGSLTSASTSLGTPDYVAPEQTADTRHADVRADIYGLGGTLYFLLTGRPPFPGSSIVEKLRGHAEQSPRPVSDFRDDVPPALLDVLDRMSAKRPEDRYQTPDDVAEALRPFSIDASAEGLVISAVPPSSPTDEILGDDDGDAYNKVESPANGILAVAVLNLVLGVWSLSTMPHTYPVEDLWSIWAAVGGISMIPATLIIMQGALRMRKRESYAWSCAAAIYAIIPWTPVWILGFPMGVWALWTLADPAVRRGYGLPPFSAQSRRFAVGIGAAFVMLPLAAGASGIVYIETDRGEIAIEAHDPDARIRVLKGGQVIEILDPVTNESVTVDTGVYTIQLGSSGFSTSIPEDKQFIVHRGKRKVVTVSRGDKQSAPSSLPKSTVDELTAEAILDRMVETYRECNSYRDSGVVKTVFFQKNGKRTVEKPFTTAFVRPDRFRFEFQDTVGGQAMRYVVWRNENEIRSWWDLTPRVKTLDSLSMALAGAVGVSGGSAITIPGLLLPMDIGNGSLTNMTQGKRTADGKLQDAVCFRLEGNHGKNGTLTLWIDQESSLVRRIDEQRQFDDFRTETTTTFDPAMNGDIPDLLLEFNAGPETQARQAVEAPFVVKFSPETPSLERDDITRDGDAWKIEAQSDRTMRLYEAKLPERDGRGLSDRLVTYHAKVKTKDVIGRAYLEMWVREPNGQKSFSRGFDDAVRGTTDWVEVQTPFWIKAGERADHADLNLVIEGGGTVWIKDVVLEAHPRLKTPAESFGDWFKGFSGDNHTETPPALIEDVRLEGHQDYVLGLDYFPDGSKIVTGGAQHVFLWDVRNGRKMRDFGESERAVHAVAVFPDGTRVAAAGKGDAIRLWDVTTGNEIRRFTGHTGFVECLAVSPDGTQLASGSSNWVRKERGDRTVRVWNVHTGQQIWQAELPAVSNGAGAVHEVMFTPDGRHVVTTHHGPRDGITVWNAATGELVRRFSGAHSSIKAAALSPDGRVLATGHEAVEVRQRRWDDSDNAVIRLWDFESGRETRRLIGHTGGIQSVAFSADGERLLSCSGGQFLNDAFNPYPSGDNSLRAWDVATGRELFRQPLEKHGQNAIFSPDGQHIASAVGEVGEKPMVQIWRMPNVRIETPADRAANGTRLDAFTASPRAGNDTVNQ